jgi:hypothetical protein
MFVAIDAQDRLIWSMRPKRSERGKDAVTE